MFNTFEASSVSGAVQSSTDKGKSCSHGA